MSLNRSQNQGVLQVALGSVPFVFLLGLWLFLSLGEVVEPIFLPSPGVVLDELATLMAGGFAWDVMASIGRVLGGFFLASIIGVPLGVMMGASRRVEEMFSPFVAFVRYLPAAAFIPLLILWLGIGNAQKVALLFMGVFFYLTIMVMNVVAGVRRDYIDAASTLGATRRQILVHVIVPASSPGIYDALRTMMGVGWTYIVVAEMVAATSGIGKMIIESQRFLQTGRVVAGIAVIGLIGVICDLIFRAGRPLLFRWSSTMH